MRQAKLMNRRQNLDVLKEDWQNQYSHMGQLPCSTEEEAKARLLGPVKCKNCVHYNPYHDMVESDCLLFETIWPKDNSDDEEVMTLDRRIYSWREGEDFYCLSFKRRK